MIDLQKHAEAIREAYDTRKMGDSLEEYWERRDAAILTALAALADEAAVAMRDAAARLCEQSEGRAFIRTIDPATLRSAV